MNKIERYKLAYGDIGKLAEAVGCNRLTVRMALNGLSNGPVAQKVIETMKKDFVYFKMK